MKMIKFGSLAGIIMAVISVGIAFFWYYSGMAENGVDWPSYCYFILFPLLVFLTIYVFRKMNTTITFGQAVGVGMTAVMLSGIIFCIYQIIFYTVIDPNFNVRMLENTIQNNPEYSDAEKKIMMKTGKEITTPAFTLLGLFIWMVANVFFGGIYATISGLILKRKKQ